MTDLPRGIRNNNPGNIRSAQAIHWQGQDGNDHEGFCTFRTDVLGIRALALDLYVACTHGGFNTPDALIRHYAPPSENDTGAYVRAVCAATGFKPFIRVDLSVRATAEKFVRAVIAHENGPTPDSWASHPNWYSNALIALGMDITHRWKPITAIGEGAINVA